jgi:serine/threonine protein kinase
MFNDGTVKLGDLNVSKVAKRGLGYTQTGTPYYASPEVWKDQPYDNKSDIWSLGCVLYEILTLRPPFRAGDMEGLYSKVIKGQFTKIPDRFSSDVFEIVKLLIQVSPDTRPNCDQLLKYPIIQKRMEYFGTYQHDLEGDNQALLQTIVVPKNLLYLSDKLPQPNYEKAGRKQFTKRGYNDLPDVKLNSIVNKVGKRVINTKIDEAKEYSLYRDSSSDRIIKRIERGRNIQANADGSRNYTSDDKKEHSIPSINYSKDYSINDSRSKERIQPISYEMSKRKREYIFII